MISTYNGRIKYCRHIVKCILFGLSSHTNEKDHLHVYILVSRLLMLAMFVIEFFDENANFISNLSVASTANQ